MILNELPWTLLRGHHDGQPVFVRNRQFPAGFDRSRFPTRLNIFWTMSDAGNNGLPEPSESARLEQFEDRLVGAVESDQHSMLSVVLTGKGEREFVFHTADVEGFLGRLSGMAQEADRYPVEIHRHDDPDWSYDEGVTNSG